MRAESLDGMAVAGTGPIVGREMADLNATLLAWPDGHRIETHVNDEVDVVTVVLAGEGVAIVDGEEHSLRTGTILLIPKGAARSIESRSDDFRYLNVHKRRRMMPNMIRPGR